MENKNVIQKLYNYRFKVDRKGKTIVNVSSLFGLACLLFAPHMTIAGVVVSLILGYHIGIESENDDTDIGERVRQAADTVRRTATSAAKSIRDEVQKAPVRQEPQDAASRSAQEKPAEIPVTKSGSVKAAEEIVEDLSRYQTAYSAVAGSVPTLEVHEEEKPEESHFGSGNAQTF